MIESDEIRVLHVTPSFYPAVTFGGPIFSTKAICDEISERDGYQVKVLTTDAGGIDRRSRLQVNLMDPNFNFGYEVRYCRKIGVDSVSLEMLARLPSAIRAADLVHLTATYSFPTLPTLFLCKVFRKPIVWSPRGGIQATHQWRNAPNARVKRVFEKLCSLLRPRKLVLHVTSESEGRFCEAAIRGATFSVIPNSVCIPDLARRYCKGAAEPSNVFRVMFMSRIHEKKGLDVLIKAMQLLPKEVILDVYGKGDANYTREMLQLAEASGVSDRVFFHGHVSGAEKLSAFARSNLFCLPTRSENFGIVIAEALAHGIPVVTTPEAPWAEIVEVGCGEVLPGDVDSFAMGIRKLLHSDLKSMGEAGRAWMKRDFSRETMGARFDSLYRRLIRGRGCHLQEEEG